MTEGSKVLKNKAKHCRLKIKRKNKVKIIGKGVLINTSHCNIIVNDMNIKDKERLNRNIIQIHPIQKEEVFNPIMTKLVRSFNCFSLVISIRTKANKIIGIKKKKGHPILLTTLASFIVRNFPIG